MAGLYIYSESVRERSNAEQSRMQRKTLQAPAVPLDVVLVINA